MTARTTQSSLYTLVVLPAVIALGGVAASLAIHGVNGVSVEMRRTLSPALPNVVAPLLAGWILCVALRLVWINRRTRDVDHLRRMGGFYLAAVALWGVIAMGSSTPDFWMFGQLLLAPAAALVGGILGDLTATPRRAPRDGGRG